MLILINKYGSHLLSQALKLLVKSLYRLSFLIKDLQWSSICRSYSQTFHNLHLTI